MKSILYQVHHSQLPSLPLPLPSFSSPSFPLLRDHALGILPLMILLRYRSDRLHDLLILESHHLLPHRPTVLVIRVAILALCVAVFVVVIVRSITDSCRAVGERDVRGVPWPADHEQDDRALSDSTCVTLDQARVMRAFKFRR